MLGYNFFSIVEKIDPEYIKRMYYKCLSFIQSTDFHRSPKLNNK